MKHNMTTSILCAILALTLLLGCVGCGQAKTTVEKELPSTEASESTALPTAPTESPVVTATPDEEPSAETPTESPDGGEVVPPLPFETLLGLSDQKVAVNVPENTRWLFKSSDPAEVSPLEDHCIVGKIHCSLDVEGDLRRWFDGAEDGFLALKVQKDSMGDDCDATLKRTVDRIKAASKDAHRLEEFIRLLPEYVANGSLTETELEKAQTYGYLSDGQLSSETLERDRREAQLVIATCAAAVDKVLDATGFRGEFESLGIMTAVCGDTLYVFTSASVLAGIDFDGIETLRFERADRDLFEVTFTDADS